MRKPLSRRYLTTGDIAKLSNWAWTQRHVLNLWKAGKLPARLCLSRASRGKHHRFVDEPKIREFCVAASDKAIAVRTRRAGKSQPQPIFPEVLPPLKDGAREAIVFGVTYVLPQEELAGLTPAKKKQVIADFHRISHT
jgi:hypothetical protein